MKDMLEKVSVQQLTTILFLGVALVVSIIVKQENLAITIGSGLVGYLGGVSTTNNKMGG